MEINGNGLLSMLRGEGGNQLPDQMDVTFALDDQLIELNLKKNRNVPSNAPVFVAEYGEVAEWKTSEANVRISTGVARVPEWGRGTKSSTSQHFQLQLGLLGSSDERREQPNGV